MAEINDPIPTKNANRKVECFGGVSFITIYYGQNDTSLNAEL